MMKHDQAERLLADYADASLPNELSSELEDHIKSCVTCTEWLVWYRELKSALIHPSSADLAQLAARPDDLGIEQRSRIEAHVSQCPECADLVSRSRSALDTSETDTSETATPIRRSQRLRWALPLAAGLLLGILGGRPLWNVSSSDGVVTYHVIGQTHRSASGLPEVSLENGVDSVLLAVNCPLIVKPASHDAMEITLSDEHSHIIWESTMKVKEARRRSNDSRMMLVAIPASRLHEGRFVIRVGAPGATERTEFPFVIVDD